MSSVLDFKVSTSSMIDAATKLIIVGTAQIKAAKVLAMGAALQGAPSEDVALKSGVPVATINRTKGLVLNGIPSRAATDTTPASPAVSASVISKAAHGLNWAGLIEGDYDSVIAAANFWNEYLVDTKTTASKGPLTITDFAILIHDTIVKADNPAEWIKAAKDALNTVDRTLAEAAAKADAAEDEAAA